MTYLGVDLGGTGIAAALVSEEGTILTRRFLPTPRGAEAVADAIAELTKKLLRAGQDDAPAYIGLGAPGTIDPEAGVIEYWSNLDFRHVPLGDMITRRTGLPVLMENDANCAALGEYAAGAGKGSRSAVVITLGTGVGGGAVLDGKLYTGFNYAGMEVGHFVMAHGGRRCTCGRRGCFEAYCSATALIKEAQKAMEENPRSLLHTLGDTTEGVTGKVIFDAAAQGDATAQAVLNEYTEYLGGGIASLINIFQPEVFCVGGGIAGAGESLLAPVRAVLEREDYARHNQHRTRLVRAKLGNDAGLIGAALLRKFR